MKVVNSIIILSIVCMLASCSSTVILVKALPTGKVPPGQMKKATGAQSAKNYAPGQMKKHH